MPRDGGLVQLPGLRRREIGALGRLRKYLFSLPIVYALPMYLIFDRIGIANSHIGVILAHSTFSLVLVVWMMKSLFDDVPRAVEEAAILDSAGPFRVFFQITLPMTYAGLTAVTIFAPIYSWIELLFALILTGGENSTFTAMIPLLVENPKGLWP